ncbi:MAG TPA: hypothetical protein VM012_01015 [Flavitalea sp.]|nr:hypothetical protein [Flavitalea sp.]
MKTRLFFCIAAILFLFISGCKKNDSTPPVKTVKEYLTQEPWKFEDAGLDADNNGTVDQADPYLQDCKKDNLVTFYGNNSGVNDEGATLCDVTDGQTTPFVWSLSNNDKNLTVDGRTVTIFSLNQTYLKAYYDTLILGSTYRYLTISKH